MEFYTKKHTNYDCEKCGFKCERKTDWSRHLSTLKHQKHEFVNNELIEKAHKSFNCDFCNKEYNSKVGLWKHNKKCNVTCLAIALPPPINETKKDDIIELLINENKDFKSESNDFKNLILDLVKSNNDLQKQMIEMCNQNNTIINNTNSHNKTFNLQLFLNEQCKDAMNIMEFVDSFKLQLSDLENVGKLGYVEGISNIIIKKLNEMDIYKRPVHCSDAKRETLYVKDNNKWEKESIDNSRLRKAIKYISKKNSDLLNEWSKNNPASQNISSRVNDNYIRLVLQAMGGSGEIEDNENKIIKRISKMVLIEK